MQKKGKDALPERSLAGALFRWARHPEFCGWTEPRRVWFNPAVSDPLALAST